MATLIDYRGLRVVSPDPTGAGGLAIQNDLKELADRLAASGYVYGLRTSWVDPSTVNIGPGGALSADGTFNIAVAAALAVRLNAAGVNGLDTGTQQPNTMYFIHVIADSTGAQPAAGLFSQSSTGPTLPPGYDRFRRVGFAVSDAQTDFLGFRQAWSGPTRRYYYAAARGATSVLSSGSATVFITVDCGRFAPPSASTLLLSAAFRSNDPQGVSSSRNARFRVTGDSDDGSLYMLQTGLGSDQSFTVSFEMPCSADQRFDYLVSNASAALDVSVLGVSDEL